jgi:hypothetical protein
MSLRPFFGVALAVLLLSAAARAAGAADEAGASGINVSIPVFATGLPKDAPAYAELGVFPRIREIEARYLPFVLRRKLAETGAWGAVRVVSDPATIEELVIHGEILQSKGTLFEVRIRAVDASGAVWLDDRFSAVPDGANDPGYERLFAGVAARLDTARRGQAPDHVATVREIALLRYGAKLAPKTFGQYLDESDDGVVSIRRLPARNDPMLDRIRRVREAEYVIIDAADGRYETLHEEVGSIYAVWQDFNRKSLGYEAQDARRIADPTPAGPRGSYEALLDAYENYKYTRMTAEERDDMAVAFDNEMRPKLARLDERLAVYNAWLEDRYRQWNRLLEELNSIETRLAD